MLCLLGPLVGARLGGVRMLSAMNYEALSGRARASFAKEAIRFGQPLSVSLVCCLG